MSDVEFPTFDLNALWPGPTRRVCEAFAPHTEAYAAGLAAEYLSGMGAIIGPDVFVKQGPSQHPARINVLLIGESGYGRKGTAHSLIEKVLSEATDEFFPDHVVDGLASGPGLSRALINLGRQAQTSNRPIDYRLWIVEEEAVNILTAGSRGANNMSAVIRKAFDSGSINVHRARSSVVINGAHICIVGHMTEEELRGRLPRVDAINGFMNRFMMIGVKFTEAKTQKATIIPDATMDEIVNLTVDAIDFTRSYAPLQVGWETGIDDEYDDFRREHIARTKDLRGAYGAAVRRADTHVLRMATLFAALDRQQKIKGKHLESAIGMWTYAQETARYVFSQPDEHADEDMILAALQMAGPRGLNSQERRRLVGQNYQRLADAERALIDQGRIVIREIPSGGTGPGRRRGKPAKMAWTIEQAPPEEADATAEQFNSLTVEEEAIEQVFDAPEPDVLDS